MVLLFVSIAMAHDHWIEPSEREGGTAVRVFVGEHFGNAQPVVLPVGRGYLRARLVTATRTHDIALFVRPATDPVALIPPALAEPGTAMLAFDGRPHDITLDPDRFDAYLWAENLVGVRALGRAGTRERYSRSLKALFAWGSPDGRAATTIVGQDLEIVPDDDPLALREGAPWSARVLLFGIPLEGVTLLVARRDASGSIESWPLRTDDEGRFRLELRGAGSWMVRLVHMVAAKDPVVDWRSYWTSLTFSR